MSDIMVKKDEQIEAILARSSEAIEAQAKIDTKAPAPTKEAQEKFSLTEKQVLKIEQKLSLMGGATPRELGASLYGCKVFQIDVGLVKKRTESGQCQAEFDSRMLMTKIVEMQAELEVMKDDRNPRAMHVMDRLEELVQKDKPLKKVAAAQREAGILAHVAIAQKYIAWKFGPPVTDDYGTVIRYGPGKDGSFMEVEGGHIRRQKLYRRGAG